VFVIFRFLHSWPATLIPALALPLSLCGAFMNANSDPRGDL
jgi:multidrug efflux pump subunit AcrB